MPAVVKMAELDDGEVFSEVFKGISYPVILVGAAYVGKTALLYRYILDDIPEGLTSTVGVEFTKRAVVHRESGSKVQLHIWDTAGQERFKSVTKHHYRGADACLLVFDISNKDSFDELPNWLAELRENSGPDCIVFLIGNKVDLDAEAKRVVSKAEATRYAKQHKLNYRETSSFWPRVQPKQANQIQEGIEVVFDEIVSGRVQTDALRLHEVKGKDTAVHGPPKQAGVKLDAEAIYKYHADSACSC